MSNVAGMLVLHMEPFDAFVSLVNLVIGTPFFFHLYKMDIDKESIKFIIQITVLDTQTFGAL